MPNKSNPVPPTTRRSARQQRLAAREANRQLARAGTRRGAGSDIAGLLLWTVAAVAVGVVVIGGAFVLTQQPSQGTSLASPIAPRVLTATDVPWAGTTLGRPDAPVTLDLYSDYQCPNCQTFAFETEPSIVNDYVKPGKVKIVMHEMVIIDSGAKTHESLDAANAARCAGDQGKYWLFHDWLFANQFGENVGSFTKDRLKYMGLEMGLDTGKFYPCVDGGQHNDEIVSAQSSVPSDVSGTPSIFVQQKIVQSSYGANYVPTYTEIKAAIEAALNPSPSPSPSASPTASAS